MNWVIFSFNLVDFDQNWIKNYEKGKYKVKHLWLIFKLWNLEVVICEPRDGNWFKMGWHYGNPLPSSAQF